ncbi:DegT/DnrJ/EryC1/StrS family aminotransferase [Psychrobium sp. 1_MG-2023]|uniref:DegT/DnrJ/EryC1/StrS aminotransferase family protein n=1 Tax=Psychrobium sp. 1_MG-2023 TaxID=3062624 RepID=UPI000C334889|nr:DegT/DnrJ/EryC1/StrS family aminotransferase [Psychrobium sp. 1_MG-2023]MDP2562106.1 DegT/DnrJ/EryC1/StrS family aminotransferase [Psychrobium sp. 1_MG-2023]PKF55705.1 aminotransferase DegT [Alteromonadales bacterium alter-6D02]
MTIKLNQPLKPDLITLTKYLSEVNNSGWYTNFGPLHDQLTSRLEEYLGVKNLLLVSNGTLALQVACKVLNINSAITTPFSFVATTSSLLWQGIDTAFSDIDPQTYNLCPTALDDALNEPESNYDGVVATHVYGNPCDVNGIADVANKHSIKTVYDAAHAFGVSIGEQSVLNFGDASTLSFHATKVFHTVEGGAIVFKHRKDYEKAKRLINFGIQADGSLGEPGINAKLNEYQCAVGLTLLDDIEQVIARRAELFRSYRDELKEYVEMPTWHIDTTLNGAYMPIYIADVDSQRKVIEALSKNGIESRRYFTPSLDAVFGEQKKFDCVQSQRVAGGVICLPLHGYMNLNGIKNITQIIKETIK